MFLDEIFQAPFLKILQLWFHIQQIKLDPPIHTQNYFLYQARLFKIIKKKTFTEENIPGSYGGIKLRKITSKNIKT